jgi:hypothetical protein
MNRRHTTHTVTIPNQKISGSTNWTLFLARSTNSSMNVLKPANGRLSRFMSADFEERKSQRSAHKQTVEVRQNGMKKF